MKSRDEERIKLKEEIKKLSGNISKVDIGFVVYLIEEKQRQAVEKYKEEVIKNEED